MTTPTRATEKDAAEWAAMRHALWPRTSVSSHLADIAGVLRRQDDESLNLIIRTADGEAAGFAEATIRNDYVNGCETSPVGFLEGIYVKPAYRRQGLAAQMVVAIEDWTRQRGCSELASDAAIRNARSRRMHEALGFSETRRVVYFRKPLS